MAAGLFKPDTAHPVSHLTNCSKVSRSIPGKTQLTDANTPLRACNDMDNGTPDRQAVTVSE